MKKIDMYIDKFSLLRQKLEENPPIESSVYGVFFDLIVGSIYSLRMAAESGYTINSNDLWRANRQVEVSLTQKNNEDLFKSWVGGYYFSNALHRLVWADERMMTFVVRCPLCFKFLEEKEINNPSFRWFEKWATSIPHIQNCGRQRFTDHEFRKFEVRLKEIRNKYAQCFPLKGNDYKKTQFARIKDLVNSQKHSIEGIPKNEILKTFNEKDPISETAEEIEKAIDIYKEIVKYFS